MKTCSFQVDTHGNVTGDCKAVRGVDSILVTGSTPYKIDAVQSTDHQKNKTEVLIDHHHIKLGNSHQILGTAPTGTYSIAAETGKGYTTTGTLRVISNDDEKEDPEDKGGSTGP
jgi:hypothetical protein